MTNIVICGIGGKMGMKILETLGNFNDVTCVAGIDAYADKSKNSGPLTKTARRSRPPPA